MFFLTKTVPSFLNLKFEKVLSKLFLAAPLQRTRVNASTAFIEIWTMLNWLNWETLSKRWVWLNWSPSQGLANVNTGPMTTVLWPILWLHRYMQLDSMRNTFWNTFGVGYIVRWKGGRCSPNFERALNMAKLELLYVYWVRNLQMRSLAYDDSVIVNAMITQV